MTPPLIVLVDDDVDFLDLNRRVLEKSGYRTACFADPALAFEAVVAETPSLIITDLMMGALDSGFSFARRVREDSRFSRIPIVIVTAVSSQKGFDFRPQSAVDLDAMRIDAFFDKPVDPKRLLSKIGELLRRPPSTKAAHTEDAP